MTREIEFRVRDSETNEILGYEYFNQNCNAGFYYVSAEEPSEHDDTYNRIKTEFSDPPMLKSKSGEGSLVREQYTGFQDIANQKIYEGDIVNICFTSENGEYLHDGAYTVEIQPLKGLIFRFTRLMWINYGYNQYSFSTNIDASNILNGIWDNERCYLAIMSKSSINPAHTEWPFNQEKVMAGWSRYFKVIGNIYENPELLEHPND